MRQLVAILALLVMTACGSNATQPAASKSAQPSESVMTPSGSTPSPSPVPTATVASPSASPATIDLACQLPVAVGSTPGFVTFPGGSFTADPHPNIVQVPTLPFAPTLIYDRPFGRWLTVPWSHVSSDGSQYLYRGSDGSIHLASISSGGDHVLVTSGASPSGKGWFPVGLTTTAIYIAAASNLNGPAPAPFYGLWSAKADGTALKSIAQSGVWRLIGNGAAWGVTPQIATSLNRLDLATAAQTVWYAPEHSVVYLFDTDTSGNPLVGVTGNNQSTYRVGFVTGQGSFVGIGLPAQPNWASADHWITTGLVTQSGIWLTAFDGSVLLSSKGGAFSVVATVSGVLNVGVGCH